MYKTREIATAGARLPSLVEEVADLTQQVEFLADQIDLSTGAPTTITAFVMGAVTPTSFGVAFDVPTADSQVQVMLYSDVGLSVLAGTQAPTPAAQEGVNRNYYRCKTAFTGLTANTTYYGKVTVNGVVWKPEGTNTAFRIKTFPVAGSAAEFSFIYGSCSEVFNGRWPSRIYTAGRNDNPLFMLHSGDFGYPNYTSDDIRVQRTYGLRQMFANPNLASLLRVCPLVLSYDDHDSAKNNADYDTLHISGTTAQIIANTVQHHEEMLPHYDYLEPGTIAQVIDVGRVRFIVPDTRVGRRHLYGTILGNGTQPPGSWDQLTDLTAVQLPSLDDDNMRLGVLVIATTWQSVFGDSYPAVAPDEQAAICDAIADLGTPVLLLTGNSHMGGFDDGENSDFSTERNMAMAHILSSGWDQPNTIEDDGPYAVNGVDRRVMFHPNLYALIEIDDTGSEPAWTATFKSNPVTTEPDDVGVVVDTPFTSTDTAPNEVSFLGPDWISPLALSLKPEKTGFGPYGDGASVQVDIPDMSFSERLTFLPNRRTLDIPLTFPGDDTAVATLSDPIGCTLGAQTSTTIHVISGFTEEAAAYLSRFATYPGDTRAEHIDTYIAGLKSAGLWDKITYLHMLGGGALADFLLNVKNPAEPPALDVETVTFAADTKVAGDGVESYIRTHYVSTQLGTQDNNSFGIWTVDRAGPVAVGITGSSTTHHLDVERTTTTIRTRLGLDTSLDVTSANHTGLIAVSRTDPTFWEVTRNGVLLGSPVSGSMPADGWSMFLGGWNIDSINPANRHFSQRGFAWAYGGEGLSVAEQLALYNLTETYRLAVGWAA
jgi:hypothetical protein